MQADELREKYLAFFESKGHARKPSDSLVPERDPSVLFTPAGMNQFKDHFLGKVKLDFTRATTCQKCIRTGDIENVGRTAYHHTFFEMLGNFSFGDYFKRDAIHWAWQFLTDTKWLGIDPERLSVSVYLDDDEAYRIWEEEIKLPTSRIERMGEDDNFWPAGAPSQGPDGVCGPCSEIFFHPDQGPEVEIWNLVFTQFNRVGDPPDNLRPLPSKNIDTGMGLERTAAVLQGVDTNFHIDILRPIVDAVAEVVSVAYDPEAETGRRLRRITDHVRACTLAIHENVNPGPKKREYVIRRLLRRAVLDGHQLGRREPFLHQLVDSVIEQMKRPYPELTETAQRVRDTIEQEESLFFRTIDGGLARIETVFGEMQKQGRVVIEGERAFDLYQTFGVPPELVESLGAERNFTLDWEGFRDALKQHSGSGPQVELFKTGPIESLKRTLQRTEFLGYDTCDSEASLQAIVAEDQVCDHLDKTGEDQPAILLLDKTPFYAEAGGQVGDVGEIVGPNGRFQVTGTQREGELVLHFGHLVEGKLQTNENVEARVDNSRRQGIRRAHSATHILHYALQKNLGTHAQQQGSKVDEDVLRFDFSHRESVDSQKLATIEQDIRQRIDAGESIRWEVLPLEEARQTGAMMLFGEKYPDPVRMVSMGEFSKELCGGTHLDNTSEVETFEIVAEEAVSAGTRRITAYTGDRAREHAQQTRSTLNEVAGMLEVPASAVPAAVQHMLENVRQLRKQLSSGSIDESAVQQFKSEASGSDLPYEEVRQALRETARLLNVPPFETPDRVRTLQNEMQDLRKQLSELKKSGDLSPEALLENASKEGDVTLVVTDLSGGNPNLMRQLIDQLRKKVQPIAILFGAVQGEKVLLVAGLSRDLVDRGLSAGNWVREVAPKVGGGGGGKPDMAQAGGKDPDKLPAALEHAEQTMRSWLQDG